MNKLQQSRIQMLCQSVMKEENQTILCGVCMDDMKISECIKLKCSHIFCSECVVDFWESLINCGKVEDLKCPQDGCDNYIQYQELKTYLKKETFEKYEQFSFNNFKIDNPNEKQINCPQKGCINKWVVWVDADYSTCSKCQFEFCTKCMIKKHDGLTCDEAGEDLDENFKALKALMKEKKWQICPVCKNGVEKEKWCNFIRCQSTSCQGKTCFCYICMEQLTEEEHFNHFKNNDPYLNGCKGSERYFKEKGKKIRTEEEENDFECPGCGQSDITDIQILKNLEKKIYQCKHCDDQYYCLNCGKCLQKDEELIFSHYSGEAKCKTNKKLPHNKKQKDQNYMEKSCQIF